MFLRYLALGLVIFLAGCGSVGQFVKHGMPDVYDYQIFETATLTPAEKPFQFHKVSETYALPPADLWACGDKPSYKLVSGYEPEQFLEETGTLALIVIRRDSILYEYYGNGHRRESVSTVFSVTKSFLSTLVGIAITEGQIESMDQPVSDFLPEFGEGKKADITIGHLLQMTSGMNFGDHANLAKLARLYYTSYQERMLKRIKVKHVPGTDFSYSSLSSYVLGLCLEKAVGMRVADYMQLKLWTPLGMEYPGYLALDREEGMAKVYGGLSATAIDLAKLGRLFLHNGVWNETDIVSANWASACRTRCEDEGKAWNYANHWWLDTYSGHVSAENKNDFFAGGFRGQVIYVNPEDSTIIVRLGTKEKDLFWGRTVSKLAMLPLGPDGNEFMELGNDLFALMDGNYRNKKKDRSLKVHFEMGRLMVENLISDGPIELVKDGVFSFVNTENNVKLIVNYSQHNVQGIIVQNAGEQMFFTKSAADASLE
jgi:CubicO group peptidase (beta-lactamase class C family)